MLGNSSDLIRIVTLILWGNVLSVEKSSVYMWVDCPILPMHLVYIGVEHPSQACNTTILFSLYTI